MEHAAKPRFAEHGDRPAAERVSQPGEALTSAGNSPAAVAQRALREVIDHSPRIAAQRAWVASIRDGSSLPAPQGRLPEDDGGTAQRASAESSLWRFSHPPHPPTPTVQRVIKIGDETITHGSRRINALHSEVVVPYLEHNEFKSYGIKSQLVAYVREHDLVFSGTSDFLIAFMAWLAGRERKTKGDKTTPVLKKFSVTGLSRPKWSGDLKTKLGFGAGDNIRHVIRNASLKRALEVEYGKYKDDPSARKKDDRNRQSR